MPSTKSRLAEIIFIAILIGYIIFNLHDRIRDETTNVAIMQLNPELFWMNKIILIL